MPKLEKIHKLSRDFSIAIAMACDEENIVDMVDIEECEVIFEQDVEDGLYEARNRAEGMI
jgi:hypothetical protein